MNQYRCETCQKKDCCLKDDLQSQFFSTQMGCASHSDFQSEREKVLDELAKWVREYDTMYYGDDMPVDIIRDKLEELRAGEP